MAAGEVTEHNGKLSLQIPERAKWPEPSIDFDETVDGLEIGMGWNSESNSTCEWLTLTQQEESELLLLLTLRAERAANDG